MIAKYFRLGNNSSFTRGFTWAASILPRSDIHRCRCPRGGVDQFPVGAFDVIVEGGTKYPDMLGCGAYPFLIVTERVADVWRRATTGSFQAYPVGIAEVHSKRLLDVTPPRYFRIELDGRCEIDIPASGGVVLHRCECHHVVVEPSVLHRFVMKPGSWDGSDLFRDHEQYPRVIFCTGKVLLLAGEHGFTNFRFLPMEEPTDYSTKGIDYLHLRKR